MLNIFYYLKSMRFFYSLYKNNSMKKNIFTIIATTVFIYNVNAQAYIFNNCINRPAYGDSLIGITTQYDTTGLTPGRAGANVTWDFTAAVSKNTMSLSHYYSSVVGSINTTDYPDANLVDLCNGDYSYYRYSPDSLTCYGYYASTLRWRIAWDPQRQFISPLNFGNSFLDFYSSHTSPNTCPLLHTYINRTISYDAYGTLKLPSVTYLNTARIKLVQYTLDSSLCFPITATNNQDIYYTWYDTNTGQPILQIHYFIDTAHNYANHFVESYSYIHLPATVLESVQSLDDERSQVSVYPNPSNGKFNMSTDATNPIKGDLKIYNVLGKVVYQKPSFEITAPGNASLDLNLPGGIYFIGINSEKTNLSKKIIIE